MACLPFDAIHTRRCWQDDAVMSVRWPPHRRLPPYPIHHCANYASIKSTATPLCYLHSHRKIQWSRADSLLMPSDGDDMMVVNTKRRWTTDPRMHTITFAFADLNQNLRTDVDQKFDYPHTVEMTDGNASSPPQLPPPTVKTCVRLNGSDARRPNAICCSLFSACLLAGLLPRDSRIERATNKIENEHLTR